MAKQSDNLTPAKNLRQRAENLLRAEPGDVPTMSIEEVQKLVQELSVHQIELEIQNEELRHAQSELAHARDRYADLYEFAPVGYLALDRQGGILEANLTAAKILGTKRKRLAGSPFPRFLAPDDADLLYLHLLRVFETDKKQTCDLQLVSQDEVLRYVRLESTKRLNLAQSPECRTVMSDVTELLLAQQAAQRSERLAALGTLAAGIAHEINNPLWMISLQAEVALAAKDKPDCERIVTQCLHEIKQLVDRGGRIVTSVLRSVKGESTAKSLETLDASLRRACDYTRSRAAIKQVTFLWEVSEELPKVWINPTEIEQVFVNVLTNAIDASPTGSSIRLAAAWNADEVTVRVEDQGCGLSVEESQRIFDPFYTTRREQGGTGLGLNVAHRIMEDHHGRIELVSQSGRGTTLSICFPIPADTT